MTSDLHALSLPAGEGFLHHAVVLAQHPVPVDHLGVGGPRGREAVGPEGVFLRGLWGPSRMVQVEDHISFGHIEVPGDDGGGLVDLDQHLVVGKWGEKVLVLRRYGARAAGGILINTRCTRPLTRLQELLRQNQHLLRVNAVVPHTGRP